MSTLYITHNAGFFSCCSVKLHSIVNYINIRRTFPLSVDSSAQFEWYKKSGEGDITYKYFEHPDNIQIEEQSNQLTIPYHHSYQFIDYSRLNYERIVPLVMKYFTPSTEIYSIIRMMEEKYNLDYSNLCVLFYRGNDKVTETNLCNYNEYLTYARMIIDNNPNTKFIIQSDETEFINFMEHNFPGSIVFYDEIRHMNKCVSSVDIKMKENIELFSKYYLAITVIMSKCKYIVCGSGNCSIWIMFYRGNNNGVFQNLNKRWYIGRTIG
jgi:hypothetical protein